MIKGHPRATTLYSSAASEVDKRPEPTPFIDESKDPLLIIEEPPPGAKAPPANCAPTEDGSIPKGVAPGELSHIATKCLMNIMYTARFARQD